MVKKSKFVAPAIEPPSATDRWRIVSLGDVVVQRQEQERNPESAGFERYLMVDHLDADRLKISRWGAIEGGDLPPTFYKVFRSGQVLYPTRNPHLRRVAYADFDGICGEKTLTLESNGEIEPRLLPFVFQTERFIEHSKSMAIGSTNPHVRWRDIAAYKFPLPPKDEQRRIAEILWAADDVCEKWVGAIATVECLIDVFRTKLFESQEWPIVPLGDLFEIKLGKMLSPKARRGVSPRPYLGNHNVQWGSVSIDNIQSMDFEGNELDKFRLRKGDLLVCEGGEVGRAAIWNDDLAECYYQKAIHRLRPIDDRAIPEFYLQFFFYAAKHGLFSGLTGHSTIAHLTAVKLRTLNVVLPPACFQRSSIVEINALIEQRKCINSHLCGCKQLKASLIANSIRAGNVH